MNLLQPIIDTKKEIDELQLQLDTIDKRWEGVKIRHAFAGGGYNHAKYFKSLEKQRITAKLKRRKNKLKKLTQ